jgi:acetylornithine deacetylase/succinyl-diaminopimelate desuccinylase-like protein
MHHRAMRPHILAAVLAAVMQVPAAAQHTMDADTVRPEMTSLRQSAARQRQAREILAEIVAIRSVAGERQGPVIAERLAARFRAAGFSADDITIVPVDDTAALVVRYRSLRPCGQKPILLLAHTDVVPADRSEWSYDPFALTEENGYFYGRGTNDNKAGVAALTATFLDLKASGFAPRRDLIIAFTGDEETTMKSARVLAREHRDLIDAEFALNSDAGYGAFDRQGRAQGFAFQTSEKTSTTFHLTVRNPGGHSARPRPDNAIYQLSEALLKIAAFRFEPIATDTTRAYFEQMANQYPEDIAQAMRRYARAPSDRATADLIEQQPGEIGTTRTTCVATQLAAGHALNALPQTARATVNCRVFPGQDPSEVESILRQVVADPGVEFQVVDQKTVSPGSPLRKDILGAYTKAVHARFPGAPVIPRMLSGMTDGAEFRAVGIPTYGVDGTWVIVPDDLRLHGKDERMSVDAFYSNLDHWQIMIKELAGGCSSRSSAHR